VVSSIGSVMSVVFDTNSFRIMNSDTTTCSNTTGDFVKLLNGRDYDSPPLLVTGATSGNGQYCGTNPPTGLQTSSNGLFVAFKSDAASSGSGFKITFNANIGTCGDILTLTDEIPFSTLSSPNYPSAYPVGVDCYWIITAPTTEAIQIDFTAFTIESHPDCAFDYVEIQEGRTGTGTVLGRYCGSSLPPTTKSNTNEVTLHFRSDVSTVQEGFQAKYSIATCGGSLVGTGGSIMSPAYPMNYPSATSCSWSFRGPAYHYLTFVFNNVSLAVTDGTVCGDGAGDFIELRLQNFTGPLLTPVICGTSFPTDAVQTVENDAYMRFQTDSSGTSSGFMITWTASEDICGGDLIGSGGSFQTPNYPNAYDHSRICTWNIRVPDDRRVTVTFNAFDVEDPYEKTAYAITITLRFSMASMQTHHH